MTDDHTVETLRLRTAALHRISRTNDELRARLTGAERERDELRAMIAGLVEGYCECGDYGCTESAWVEAVRAVLDGGR